MFCQYSAAAAAVAAAAVAWPVPAVLVVDVDVGVGGVVVGDVVTVVAGRRFLWLVMRRPHPKGRQRRRACFAPSQQ